MVVQNGRERAIPVRLEKFTSEDSGLTLKVDDVRADNGAFCARCARNKKQKKGSNERQALHGLGARIARG